MSILLRLGSGSVVCAARAIGTRLAPTSRLRFLVSYSMSRARLRLLPRLFGGRANYDGLFLRPSPIGAVGA